MNITPFKAPIEDILFSLNSVAGAADLPGWDSELVAEILEHIALLAEGEIAPLDESGDLQGCVLVNGCATTEVDTSFSRWGGIVDHVSDGAGCRQKVKSVGCANEGNDMTDHRTIMAANNNADWYSMMFDIHGLQYCRTETAFLGADPPPRYHSWMTTLDPNAGAEISLLVEQNAYRPRFGIKDSFNCLKLSDEGFVELFSATWIFAETIQLADTTGWIRIESVSDLLLWEIAWNQGSAPDQRHFPNSILLRNDVVIWGRRESNEFDAGVITNISKDCVGLSNCFGHGAYPAAATLCAKVSQGKLPIVGYEHGDDLSAALEVGFSALDKLCIWDRS